jgi:hypothetical protein
MTSSAKFSCFFSMPAPTSRRANDFTVAPACLRSFSTVVSGILHKRLPDERDLGEELADTAFDHLLDDRSRLALARGLTR